MDEFGRTADSIANEKGHPETAAAVTEWAATPGAAETVAATNAAKEDKQAASAAAAAAAHSRTQLQVQQASAAAKQGPTKQLASQQQVTLQLLGNGLSKGYATALAFALRQFDRDVVTVFDLSNGGLDDSYGAALIKGVCQQRCLTTLDLRSNLVGRQTALELESLLVPPTMRVTTLRLGDNRLADAGTKVLAAAFMSGQSWNSLEGHRHYPNATVKTLDLRRNAIGDAGALSIGNFLELNKTITDLDLSWNTIRRRGCVALIEALRVNGSCVLRKLNLSHNLLPDTSARELAEVIAEHPTLCDVMDELDLNHNCIEDAVLRALHESQPCIIYTPPEKEDLLTSNLPHSIVYSFGTTSSEPRAEPFSRTRLPQITSPGKSFNPLPMSSGEDRRYV